MHISNTTLLIGTSHINPERPQGLKFHTEEGKQYFEKKMHRFLDAEEHKAFETYRPFLEEELKLINDDLTFFLEDEEMEKVYNMGEKDEEGWEIYYTLLDKYNVLKYFIRRMR